MRSCAVDVSSCLLQKEPQEICPNDNLKIKKTRRMVHRCWVLTRPIFRVMALRLFRPSVAVRHRTCARTAGLNGRGIDRCLCRRDVSCNLGEQEEKAGGGEKLWPFVGGLDQDGTKKKLHGKSRIEDRDRQWDNKQRWSHTFPRLSNFPASQGKLREVGGAW